MGQNAVGQSIPKKEINVEVYFWHANKHQIFLQLDTITLGVYPKLEVCISLQYLQENMGDEVDFLSADKHESFLQVDSITLGVHS